MSQTGTVKFFNATKGFGFITKQRLFLHDLENNVEFAIGRHRQVPFGAVSLVLLLLGGIRTRGNFNSRHRCNRGEQAKRGG